jgi:hypothetical protein
VRHVDDGKQDVDGRGTALLIRAVDDMARVQNPRSRNRDGRFF